MSPPTVIQCQFNCIFQVFKFKMSNSLIFTRIVEKWHVKTHTLCVPIMYIRLESHFATLSQAPLVHPTPLTLKPIFILRQMVDKPRAAERSFHLRFVDLEKAYNLNPRTKL